jgi:hypothetical protein
MSTLRSIPSSNCKNVHSVLIKFESKCMFKWFLEYDISWLENRSTICRDEKQVYLRMLALHPCTEFLTDVHIPAVNKSNHLLMVWKS